MSSTHGAYIGRIKTHPHPNADKLLLGKLGGFQVIVSNATENNQLGVFFSSDLKVSSAYADANNLRRIDGGFFEDNLRVRAINLRSEKSEGYFAPLSSLAFTGIDITTLTEGMMFTELNKVAICEKYVNKHLRQGQQRNARKAIAAFPKHYDTEQLGYYLSSVPVGSVVWFTLKCHGTSQRTGMVTDGDNDKRSWWARLRNKPQQPELVSGTRNTVLGQYKGGESTKTFRFKIHDSLQGLLRENEILFYEIVGWEDESTTIMGKHDFSKTKEYKHWGKEVVYSYGVLPGTCRIYVYRIANMYKNEMGLWLSRDLAWPQVVSRCEELAINYTPVIHAPYVVTEDKEELLAIADSLADGPDYLDSNHPREGVVLHVLTPAGRSYALKHKGMTFKVGEGIAIERDDYHDTEEVS